jgi:hypothetical protein
MLAIREHVEQPAGQSQGVQLAAHHFQLALEAVTKASQFARAQRLLHAALHVERSLNESQQTLVEMKPAPQRTSPLP